MLNTRQLTWAPEFCGPRTCETNMNLTCRRLLRQPCVDQPSQEAVHISSLLISLLGFVLTSEAGAAFGALINDG